MIKVKESKFKDRHLKKTKRCTLKETEYLFANSWRKRQGIEGKSKIKLMKERQGILVAMKKSKTGDHHEDYFDN